MANRRNRIIGLVLLLLPAALLLGQTGSDGTVSEEEPLWVMAEHTLGSETMAEDISRIVAEGYVPVGMEQRDQTVHMLYIDNPDINVDRWVIQEFEDLDNLNEEMSAPMLEGWVPMDISKTENGLTVLFVLAEELQAAGWRIDISPLEATSIQETYANWRNQGFEPYGISLSPEDEVWYLLIDEGTDEEPAAVFFNGYPRLGSQVADGITEDIASGAIPWGLMVGDDTLYVHYLR